MARVVMTLLGALLLGAGGWIFVHWWDALKWVLLAVAAGLLVIIGLALLILGISEIAGSRAKVE